jgi:hypothetical protein
VYRSLRSDITKIEKYKIFLLIKMNVEQFNLALIGAVKSRDYGAVHLLLQNYPKHLVSWYPLVAVIEEGNDEMVELLLSDQRFQNDYILYNAMLTAIERTNTQAVSLILQKMTTLDISFLYKAVEHGNLEMIQVFTEDMRVPTEAFYECAKIATELGNKEVLNYFYGFWNAEYIIEKNKTCNLGELTSNGYSLHDIMTAACKKGKIRIVKFLYRQGIVPTQQDCLEAKRHGHDKVAKQIYNILCQDLSKIRKQL